MEVAIKLIATTAEGFEKLEAFRDGLADGCKAQIDTIGTGFGGFELRYRLLCGKEALLPGNPNRISYGDSVMRVHYEKMIALVPYSGEPIAITFLN